ncbi:MAG: succinate-semialdehyde dehydrogenase / glutarate-semialdehyde dehydrogenase [Burkholderiales bacterium]
MRNGWQDMYVQQVLIDGQWHDSQSGDRFSVTNPADNASIADVPDCDAKDAVLAVDAAHAAFPAWRNTLARERAFLLKKWHALILENKQGLAELISVEQGKPIAESMGEVAYAAAYVEWFAEEARRSYGDVIPSPQSDRKLMVVKEPVGVVAAITPWNFPMAMLARKIAPALAAGCTVVAKPSEETPLSALALARLVQRAGVPDGVVNIVTASRARTPDVVDAWLADPRVSKISFTGSTAVGKYLARRSAETLKKVSLELGGNAPFIVFDDADIDAAVAGILAAKFRNTGQTCVSPNRILVQDGVHNAFADKLANAVKMLKVAPATAIDAQQGPLINARALAKVEEHVQDAVTNGALLHAGGKRHALAELTGGHFYEPTVLSGATTAMKLAEEETFGPVAALFRFTTEAEAVRLANATRAGLAAYFYSRDIGRIHRVADALEVGMVGVNEGAISTEVAPFGGVKESGYGREGSRYGLDDYQHIKYICIGGLGTAQE